MSFVLKNLLLLEHQILNFACPKKDHILVLNKAGINCKMFLKETVLLKQEECQEVLLKLEVL